MPIQVAGGGPGWQVAGGSNAQGGIGDREDAAGDEILQVTGDGHQGIGPSGVGPSAVGHRLRVPERPDPQLLAPVPVTCHPELYPPHIIRSPFEFMSLNKKPRQCRGF